MKLAKYTLSIAGVLLMTVVLFSSMGCDEGMNMVGDVVGPIDEPGDEPDNKPVDPTMNGEVKKPDPGDTGDPIDTIPDPGDSKEPIDPPTDPEPEPTIAVGSAMQQDDGSITVSGTGTDLPTETTVTVAVGDITKTTKTDESGNWTVTIPAKKAEQLAAGEVTVSATAAGATGTGSLVIADPEPTDTVAPTVVNVGWYSDNRLSRLVYNNREPGATVYVWVAFSEPVEHIVGDGANARPALSLVIGGQATRLRVLPHNAGNRAFVSGTCKPFDGSTDTFVCVYTIPTGSVGMVELQVGTETADMAGNAADESYHTATFIVEAPEPPRPEPIGPIMDVVPPLKTLVPAVMQERQPPVSNPGDFVGQVRTLYSTSNRLVNSTQPLAAVSVTITAGAHSGEQVTTDEGGYYHFLNVNTDELYLRVEREHFEPKEVIVHRSRPTVLQQPNGGPTLERRDPWNTPGVIVMGQRWPDEVRFIFESTLLPNDVLFVRDDGYKSPDILPGLYYYSGRLSGIVAITVDRISGNVNLSLAFAHEVGHAHQHAMEIMHNTGSWRETPEGRAYARARERDWDEVGKSFLDHFIVDNYSEGAHLREGAAEFSSHYWSRGTAWATGRRLESTMPNRFRWAEEWLDRKY